jgi:hypothetical protein
MKIEIKIFDGEEPKKQTFYGQYALEEMLARILPKYFGDNVTGKILNLLKSRLKINENMEEN